MVSGGIRWKTLFPTRSSPYVFVGYMVLFIAQGILVTASQTQGSAYDYNTVTVVLLTEVVKLLVSVSLYVRGHSVLTLCREVNEGFRILLLYFVPALLYCIYNNLAFVNLSAFDPTTYYLLLQFRVVLTGLVFQLLFSQRLSRKQWFSLILLTAGCMIKQIDSADSPALSVTNFSLNMNHMFILIQTLCSCVAGVSNERILKTEAGANVNIFVHNIFMCAESIVCNVGVLLLQGSFWDAFADMSSILTWKVVMVIANNAAIGITTSLFLKHLSAILKTFASALELMFTPLCCWIIFGIPIYTNTVVAIAIVTYAVFLYSQNPVVTDTRPTTQVKDNYLLSLRIV